MGLTFNLNDQGGAGMSGTLAVQRVYRTVDGELVRENDPRGAFLAYSAGDPVADAEIDAYNDIVAGKRSGHEVPGLMHTGLATEVADAARLAAAADPNGPAVAVAQETLRAAADLVDAHRIPLPAPVVASPAEVLRQFVADADDDRPVTDVPLYRTADGGLVGDGDTDGVTLAYAKGDRVEEADQDAHAGLAKAARSTGTKQASKPGDKAAAKLDNK